MKEVGFGRWMEWLLLCRRKYLKMLNPDLRRIQYKAHVPSGPEKRCEEMGWLEG